MLVKRILKLGLLVSALTSLIGCFKVNFSLYAGLRLLPTCLMMK